MSNKNRIIAFLVMGVIFIAAGAAMILYGKNSSRSHSTNMFAMDTACTLTLYGSSDLSQIKDRITELDGAFSAYDENGEIYRLNENRSVVLSEDSKRLIEEFLSLYEEYGGVNPAIGEVTKLWDITGENPSVPNDEEIAVALKTVDAENISIEGDLCTLKNNCSVDIGAVGKGFALDEIKTLLDGENTQCAVISFGSSTLLYGEKPDGTDFTVSVADPDNDGESLLKFHCGEGFVSTSGGYERFFEADGKRYIHIFDENTGNPVQTDLSSVTVICDSGIKSDFLSTRIFIGGTAELEDWLSNEAIEIIAVDNDGQIYYSKSLEGRIGSNQSQ